MNKAEKKRISDFIESKMGISSGVYVYSPNKYYDSVLCFNRFSIFCLIVNAKNNFDIYDPRVMSYFSKEQKLFIDKVNSWGYGYDIFICQNKQIHQYSLQIDGHFVLNQDDWLKGELKWTKQKYN